MDPTGVNNALFAEFARFREMLMGKYGLGSRKQGQRRTAIRRALPRPAKRRRPREGGWMAVR